MLDQAEMSSNTLSQIVESNINRIPVFKTVPDTDKSKTTNSRKAVLRGVFNPLAVYIFGKNLVDNGEVLNPEKILQKIIDQQEFNTDKELVKILVKRFGLNSEGQIETKWLEEEALKISLEGNNHPLNKLAQEVTKQLPEDSKKALTQISF